MRQRQRLRFEHRAAAQAERTNSNCLCDAAVLHEGGEHLGRRRSARVRQEIHRPVPRTAHRISCTRPVERGSSIRRSAWREIVERPAGETRMGQSRTLCWIEATLLAPYPRQVALMVQRLALVAFEDFDSSMQRSLDFRIASVCRTRLVESLQLL